jgi:hypothetical protein
MDVLFFVKRVGSGAARCCANKTEHFCRNIRNVMSDVPTKALVLINIIDDEDFIANGSTKVDFDESFEMVMDVSTPSGWVLAFLGDSPSDENFLDS